LTPDELALYLRIAYHARPPWWLCVAGTEALCDSCLSDKKVRAAKKTLQATKRIKITRRLNQTDQITIVNRVLDHRDVYVPREVVLALRPPELAIYCRIADRDRGTGCKAQNKELAINVCTVRQVANILAKLESNGLIRRYEIDGKRFISSSAYGFKAHATHLAELEKQAAEACNLGGVPRKNQQGTKGNIGGVTPCNFGGDKEVPKNQFPEKEQHGGSPLVGDAKTDNSACNGDELVPIEVFIRRVLETAGFYFPTPTTTTKSGASPNYEAELAAKWERKQAEGYTLADALFYAELIRQQTIKLRPNQHLLDYCLSHGMELARQFRPIEPTLAQCVEVLTKIGEIEKQTAPTASGLSRALEPKWKEQWQQCLRDGHTLRDLLKLDLDSVRMPHDVYLGNFLSRYLPHTSGDHEACANLPGKGCDSVFHWTRDGRVLICPRFTGDVEEWGINHWKRDDA
jgi:DNA-binding MarR family transcriptional regulator